ncbi:MAG: hypothetical protein ACXW35_11780, partial [Nitrospira sp.]
MKANILLLFFLMFSLTACGQFQVSIDPLRTSVPTSTVEPPAPTSTAVVSPTTEILPTATVVPPSPTLALPTATQVQPAPPTSAAPTSITATEQNIKIVLIALEDNGQSGTLVG